MNQRNRISIVFRIAVFAFTTVLVFRTSSLAQDPGWKKYLHDEVARIAARSAADLQAVTSENWPTTRAKWHAELKEMLGLAPLPERTDLQATIVESFEHDGLTIQRLHYQSRPGLYVGANLYLPKGEVPAGGWPAVLYVCGHANITDQGRLLGNKTSYQHHGLWFARHQTVCLIIDTIQLGEFHGEHHGTYKMGRWDWISRGYTPAGVEAWNAIRGIDYLQSLKQVDANRIGITGRSGGGAYSWFAAALDERIKAAVPVAGITDLEDHVVNGCVEGHCDCMYFVNYHGWDYPKLAATMAPRALLLANSDTDGIFPMVGVVRTHMQVRRVYEALKASDKYGVLITPGPHKDTQELQVGAFRWLLKHLTGVEPIVERAALKEFPMERLAVFDKESPLDEKVTSASNWFVSAASPVTDVSQAAQLWKDQWRTAIARTVPLAEALAQPSVGYTTVLEGQHGTWRWRLRELNSDHPWKSRWLELESTASVSGTENMIHVGVVTTSTLTDSAAIGRELTTGDLPRRLAKSNAAKHFVLLPRGHDWTQWGPTVRSQTQIMRRFYLLGQSVEGLALVDILKMYVALSEQSDRASTWDMVGHDRWSPLATIAGLEIANSPSRNLPKLARLHVSNYPTDPLLAPALPGIMRVSDYGSLLAAAKGTLRVVESTSTDRSMPTLLVDTAIAPQQSMGFRIVEVGQKQATIWARATRWPLPNLGDLPEVRFRKVAGKKNAKQNSGPLLPESGVDGLRFAVPGVVAEMRLRFRRAGEAPWTDSAWTKVDHQSDFSCLLPMQELVADSQYEIRVEARAPGATSVSTTLAGSLRTLPEADQAKPFRLAVGTCQEFNDRDGAHGFDVYRTMLDRKTDAYVLAGDVVYYDALARSIDLANYHWQRTYSLPTLVNFHKQVPTYFLKDDHDTYVNDSWPGQHFQWTDDFRFEDGQRIFVQQTALPSPAYRTIQLGRDLQIWMLEGRDHRSPNNAKDTPDKTILGAEQKKWLEQTLRTSTAKFRVIISPTPIVGPDRENKHDNLSNDNFTHEGRQIRQLLASFSNTVVVCGDRHWQYHSVDPETKLHEFSVGPVSNRHASGWKKDDFRPDMHQYLRVAGGYLEIELSYRDSQAQLVLAHLDPYGQEHHRHELR